MPIHMSSTYAQVDAAVPVFEFDYSRCGNPTRMALEKQIASLEGGKHALAASSGCAVTMLCTHLCKAGDHILAIDDVYGGTGRFFRKMAVDIYGMEVDFVNMTDLSNVEAAFKDSTQMV